MPILAEFFAVGGREMADKATRYLLYIKHAIDGAHHNISY